MSPDSLQNTSFRGKLDTGFYTKKLSRWGVAQDRQLTLTHGDKGDFILAWTKAGKAHGATPSPARDDSFVRLSDVRSITNGLSQQSPNFRRKGKGKKMALYVSVVTHSRSLDLEMETEQERDWFVTGLRNLCHELNKARSKR